MESMNKQIKDIHDYIINLIAEEKLRPGERVPSGEELAATFKTGRMNGHRAVKELENEGIVKRSRGLGTFVSQAVSPAAIQQFLNPSEKYIHLLYSFRNDLIIHWNDRTVSILESELRRKGFIVIHKEYPDIDTESMIEFIKSLNNAGSCGLILFPEYAGKLDEMLSHPEILMLYKSDIYVYNTGHLIMPEMPLNCIALSPYNDGFMVGRILKRSGHRNIYFLSSRSLEPKWALDRYHGIVLGLSGEKERPGVKLSSQIAEMADIIKKSSDHICVVTASDRDAVALLDMTAKEAVKCPERFELISFDNNPNFRAYNITTAAPPVEKVGTILGKMISGNHFQIDDGDTIKMTLRSGFIERQTFRIRY
jgi:DNA-binding LacI/PurR family transcriptional regulator